MQFGRRVLAVAAAAAMASGAVWAAQGRTLEVTATYTGAGDVSASNALYLTVWDTPDFQGGALPIGAAVVIENGGTASFPNLTASPVYVAALYDSNGGWDGLSAVPSGSAAGMYAAPGAFVPAPVELTEGETVEIDLSFNDAFKMP